MKKNWKALISAFLTSAMLLCGCSAGTSTDTGSAEVIKNADALFLADLESGLEARWKLSEEQEAEWTKSGVTPEDGSEEQIEAYTALVNAEMEHVAKYSNAEFNDEALAAKADVYIQCLYIQQRALTYAESDYEQFRTDWAIALADRCMMLADFVADFGLTVDSQYQQTLNDLVALGQAFREAEKDSSTGSGSAA